MPGECVPPDTHRCAFVIDELRVWHGAVYAGDDVLTSDTVPMGAIWLSGDANFASHAICLTPDCRVVATKTYVARH